MFFFRVTVLVVIYTSILLHSNVQANEPYVIKAAVAKEFKDGLHSSYLKYIAKQLGMEINITTMPFARRIIEVKKGNLDLIIGLHHTKERASDLIFILPAYEQLSFRFFSLNENATAIGSYNNLGGKMIGVIRGAKYFSAFEHDKELKKYPLKNLKTNIDMLLLGRIDLFVHYEESTIPMLKLMKVDHLITKTKHQPNHSDDHYLAISKSSPLAIKRQQLMAIVERGIRQQDFIQLRLEHYQKNQH